MSFDVDKMGNREIGKTYLEMGWMDDPHFVLEELLNNYLSGDEVLRFAQHLSDNYDLGEDVKEYVSEISR